MTWYYASVTEVVATDGDKATLRVLYDDYAPDDPAGQDLINVPDDDTVTCDPEHPRVKASADDRLRIGKTFVWPTTGPLRIGRLRLASCQPVCRLHPNSSLSHFSAMTRPIWLDRAARNRATLEHRRG